jgi:serine/threonine-protein kinase
MGRVLLAHDPVLDREVALKHLRDDLRIPREVREGLVVRMRHEARAAARVAHPNIVTLHDMCEDAELGLYLVFEYVEGPTLKDRLRDGPLSPPQAARLARELGEALTLAHGAGVVHRDIKPENIILSITGGKVADFGIARIPDSTLTHQGGLMGTPAYSAPETFRVGRFSPESDQFSLAAVMYEAISGERAFPGEDAVSVAARIASETPGPISGRIGIAGLDEVLSRALSKRPEQRFPSCEAFSVAFARCVEESPAGGARPPSSGSIRPPPPPGAAGPQQPPAAASEGTGGGAPTRDAAPSDLPPPERKLSHVLLGAAVVVVTAALLVRTALRSGESTEPEPDTPAATAAPPPSASAAPKPRATATARTARPRQDPGPAATPGLSSTAATEADAGPPPPAADAGADAAPAGGDAGEMP